MISAKQAISLIAKRTVPIRLRDALRPYWERMTPSADERLRARDIATLGPEQRWSSLQNEEIDFWDKIRDIGNVDPQHWPETRFLRTHPDLLLQGYLTRLIDAPPGSRVEVLDVGAGPLTILGKKWPGHEVRITAVDANAAEYDLLLEKHGIVPLCRTICGYAEELTSVVPPSSFDLVHARNCIDHSKDPMRAIQEMVRAVKTGHYVFLNHRISEGRNEKYWGPHQWNLFPRHSRFYIERPGMRAIDVGQTVFRKIADVAVGPSPDGPSWFCVTIKRLA